MRTARRALPALLLSAALISCGSDGTGTGADPQPSATSSTSATTTSTSASSSPSSSASTGQEGPLSLVDAVVVAADRSDPLSAALATAVQERRTLLLDVVASTDEADLAAGRLVMNGRGAPPGRGTGLQLQITPGAVSELSTPLVLITGTFDVTSSAEGTYVLEAITTESDPALRPQGMDDAERCAAVDVAAAQAAADRLRQDPAARAELREAWGSSPSVWWAVQFEAESPGDLQAAVDAACAVYRG